VIEEGIRVRNPAGDVTPAELVTAVITENGVISFLRKSENAAGSKFSSTSCILFYSKNDFEQ
jgi:methylthioribose-1-phosphate isomerase